MTGMGGRSRFTAMTRQAGGRVDLGCDDVGHGLGRVTAIASGPGGVVTLGAVAQVLNKDCIPSAKTLSGMVVAYRTSRAYCLTEVGRLQSNFVTVAMPIEVSRVTVKTLATRCFALGTPLQGTMTGLVTTLASQRRVDLPVGHKWGASRDMAANTVYGMRRTRQIDSHQGAVIRIGVIHKICAMATIAVASYHAGCRPGS